ncbi:MAG: neuraminidase-like domain-containing protein [Pseudonocardia sp.]
MTSSEHEGVFMGVIVGRLISAATRQPVEGFRVEAWPTTGGADVLGSDVTDGEGAFAVEIDDRGVRALLVQGADVEFRVFSPDGAVIRTPELPRWSPREPERHLLLAVPTGEVPATIRRVTGLVADLAGVARAGLRVEAWDRDLGGSMRLAVGLTDRTGRYDLTYDIAVVPGKAAADLEIRVVDPRGERREVARAATVFDAPEAATVDVAVDATALAPVPELDRLLAAAEPVLAGREVGSLDPDGVLYLAERAGWDARTVAMAVQAERLREASGIPVEHGYALMRAGLPTDPDALAQVSDGVVERTLAGAVAAGVISDGQPIEETVLQHRAAAAERLRTVTAPGATTSLGSMLGLRLDEAQQAQFVEAYRATAERSGALWTELAARGFDEPTVARLRTDGVLGRLTRQNAPLIGRLTDRHGIDDPAALARAGLYDAGRWAEVIGDDVPVGLTRQGYAEGLAAQVDLAFPTVVAADLVRRNRVDLGGRDEVVAFLEAADGERLGERPVRMWAGFAALSAEGRSGVQRLERLYQVSPSHTALAALVDLGIGSAAEIARQPADGFVTTFGAAIGDPQQARAVHRRAVDVHAATVHVATTYLSYRGTPNVYGLTGDPDGARPLLAPQAGPAAATLETLFEAFDVTTCDHCRSVHGPSAYLVDLFEFLDKPGVAAGENPLTVLFARRPDLPHIELSCENVEVALPYVDVVNEILEHYVVHGDLDDLRGHDVEPGTSSADLLADPQFVADAAYERTRDRMHPYELPFDLSAATVDLLLQVWDTTTAHAREVFGDLEGARHALLGLRPGEYEALTDTAYRALPEYFGLPAGHTLDQLREVLSSAGALARALGITYEELTTLLRARVVSPAAPLVPSFDRLDLTFAQVRDFLDGTLSEADLVAALPPALDATPYGADVPAWLTEHGARLLRLVLLTGPPEAGFAELEVRFAHPDAPADRLDALTFHAMHRLVRLSRRLDRSIEWTDQLLHTFLGAELTDANLDDAFAAALSRIANLERLFVRLDVGARAREAWLGLWSRSRAARERTEALALVLRAGVTDLVHLSELSGIDPFADDLDDDEPSLHRFVDMWLQLKAVSVKVADLDWLLRHHDGAGDLTRSVEDLRRDVAVVRATLAAVDAELDVAPENPDLTLAQARMAQAYSADAVQRFFALLGGGIRYATAFDTAMFGTALEVLPTSLTRAGLELDGFAEALVYSGVMSDAARTALDTATDALQLGDLDPAVVSGQGELDAFRDAVKAAVALLHQAGRADLDALGAEYPELAAVYAEASAADPAARPGVVLAATLPELREARKAAALRTVLAQLTGTDPLLVEALAALLPGAAGELLADFRALQDPVRLQADGPRTLLLEAAATDDHRLWATAPEHTRITLSVDGTVLLDDVEVGPTGEIGGDDLVPLVGGRLTPLDVTVAGLPADGEVALVWRTRTTARGPVPAGRIHDAEVVARAASSLVRLTKAAALARILGLTSAEVVQLGARTPETADVFTRLDPDGTIDDDELHRQAERVRWLAWFAAQKKAHESEPDVLAGILARPDRTTPQGTGQLAELMGWVSADLDDVLAHHGYALAELGSLAALDTVTRTLALVAATQQRAEDLRRWVTTAPSPELVRVIRTSLRARLSDDAWRETMTSVNDQLRNRRRDALVAYVLHHAPPVPEITTAEKLYEHFLVDVQMDSCARTSRIRLALSTVQLFVTRCLLNLEPDVSPGSIDADHWQWMQRYRLWEANRKVFLYPENWLEPELRDDKSPFFRELETDLLKADITDELAEAAYLGYLRKLDDIAKLEIVGAYLDQRRPGNPEDDVLHVVGRTNGTTREHYLRRHEYGYWTPWEKVSLPIEGDVVVPVVWRGRLCVFWLRILTKPHGGARSKNPEEMGGEAWGNNISEGAEVSLCWGEYHQGRWTSPKSSEMSDPIRLTGMQRFDPARLMVQSRTEKPDHRPEKLIFDVYYLDWFAGIVTVHEVSLASTHRPPAVRKRTLQGTTTAELLTELRLNPYFAADSAGAVEANGARIDGLALQLAVLQPGSVRPGHVTELVLTRADGAAGGLRVHPLMHPVENLHESPFFYADEHAILHVRAEETIDRFDLFDGYYDIGGIVVDPGRIEIPVVIEDPVLTFPRDPLIDPLGPLVNPHISVRIPDETPFVFDGVPFDSRGRVDGRGGR